MLDRPISSFTDDTLGRMAFVRRLAQALIAENRQTQQSRSTGLVVGISGAWGSGKSSILNLLREHLRELGAKNKYDQRPLLIQFNPWLVNRRDDLIAAFFRELIVKLHERGQSEVRNKLALNEASRLILDYAELVSGAAELAGVSSASGLVPGLRALRRFANRDVSLESLRKSIDKSISNFEFPIIIFIDELDRVDDDEVHAIAQFVRAIADFRSVSYILAYDYDRVVNALGRDNRDRGSAYLEKIVHLQIPIPETSLESLTVSFEKYIDDDLGHKELDRIRQHPRYQAAWKIVHDNVATLRDTKRLYQTFRIIYEMSDNEVDVIDILLWCLLLNKYPWMADHIKREPWFFVSDSIKYEDYIVRASKENKASYELISERFQIDEKGKNSTNLRALLEELFPSAMGVKGRTAEDYYVRTLRIERTRALKIVSSYDIAKDVFTNVDINMFLDYNAENMHHHFSDLINQGQIDNFLDRFSDYIIYENKNVNVNWLSIGQAATKFSKNISDKPENWPNIIYSISRIYLEWVDHTNAISAGKSEIKLLINSDFPDLAANILRMEMFSHGLFDTTSRGRELFPREFIESCMNSLAQRTVTDLKNDQLLCRLTSSAEIFNALSAKFWADSEREYLSEYISRSSEHLIALAFILFPRGFSTELSTINRIVDVKTLGKQVNTLLQDEEMGKDIVLAISQLLPEYF